MEKSELREQFEEEQDRIAVVEHSTGKVYLPKYGEWLERKVLSLIDKTEELVLVLNAVCVLFDNGERKITVGERANLLIAKAVIEKYPKEWIE